jgi:hypothetical protein
MTYLKIYLFAAMFLAALLGLSALINHLMGVL